jgi:tRNA1(Val) A37 N6-methylase TrmN6
MPLFQRLIKGIDIAVEPGYGFTTDAVLLSRFAAPAKNERVCDLGCGAGVIPLLCFGHQETPPLLAAGIDIDPVAVKLFNASIEKNGLTGRVFGFCADLKKPPHELIKLGPFDCVTCNPPYYIGSHNNPASFEVLCSFEDVLKTAARLLRFGGRLCLCHRPDRLAHILSAMLRLGIEPKLMRPVAYKPSGNPRLVLLQGRLGARPGLKILPQLTLTGHDGKYTGEAAKIYRME